MLKQPRMYLGLTLLFCCFSFSDSVVTYKGDYLDLATFMSCENGESVAYAICTLRQV